MARHVHLLRHFCPCLDSVTPSLILSGIKVFQLKCSSGICGDDAFTIPTTPLESFPSKVKLQWRAYLKVFVDERLPVRFDLSELWPQPFDLALHPHDVLKVPLRPQVQHLNWLRHVLHLLKRMEQRSIDFPVGRQIKMSTMFSRCAAQLAQERMDILTSNVIVFSPTFVNGALDRRCTRAAHFSFPCPYYCFSLCDYIIWLLRRFKDGNLRFVSLLGAQHVNQSKGVLCSCSSCQSVSRGSALKLLKVTTVKVTVTSVNITGC